MAAVANPLHKSGGSRLRRFVLASLLLHALALGLGRSDVSGLRLPSLGDTTLRIQIASDAARAARRVTANHTILTAPADRALPTRDVAAETATSAHTETAAARDSDPAAVQNYLIGVLQSELTRYLRYPALARERGWQGTVLVGVAVSPDGVLTAARLLRSSGYTLLDETSLSSLRRLHKLPVETARFGPDPVEVILPIRFRLADNS